MQTHSQLKALYGLLACLDPELDTSYIISETLLIGDIVIECRTAPTNQLQIAETKFLTPP